MKKLFVAAASAVLAVLPAVAMAKNATATGFNLPADKPVTIVIMRPDVLAGSQTTAGLPEANADWTEKARKNIVKAIEENQKKRSIAIGTLPQTDQSEDNVRLIADYEALHRAVASAILAHKFGLGAAKLPTKKDKFDWTMGPGTQKIGEVANANYGLFLYSRDYFASGGRQALQAAGLLGCLVGVCVVVGAGYHVSYASLVELSTGNVVWFNVFTSSKGDIRDEAGSQAMIDALTTTMPIRPDGTTLSVAKK